MVSEHDRPASTTLRASSSLAAIGDRPLQEPVVDRQVGSAGPAAASRDASRQHVDRGVVGDAAALDDPERRLACRLETRGLARPADRPERAPPAGGVHPVDPLDEPRRHVAPDRRLPEGPGEDGDPAAAVGSSLVKPSCLIVDEVGRCDYDRPCTDLFFDVVDRRYEKEGPNAMVLTSNIAPSGWDEFFTGDDTLLCALDRLLDKASVFVMRGPSYRGSGFDTYSVEAVPQAVKVRGIQPEGM